MIKFYISILIILNSINFYGFQKATFSINDYKENYVEFLNINEIKGDSLEVEILNQKPTKIKSLTPLDSRTKIQELSNNNRNVRFLITKSSNENFKPREKFVLEDIYKKEYNLVLAFYSKKINLDSIDNENFNFLYSRKDYPIRLICNSHVIGDYLIFDNRDNQISNFEMLDSFYLILGSLENGGYQLFENDKNTPLLSFQITD